MVKMLPKPPANSAFFFDFDGTLVDIAPRPDLVHVEPQVFELLSGLETQVEGAVAVVTGRPLDVVDAFLSPLRLPVAAEHGAIRRDSAGRLHRKAADPALVETAYRALAPFVEANSGLVLERKQSSLALHYRQRPELADSCAAAAAAAGKAPDLIVLPGKMVFEIKPKGVDKGEAVRAFLDEAPFKGRIPIFAGDDVTDEHGFELVNARGGLSIKIGDGETKADYRTDRNGLFEWLKGAEMAGLGAS